MYKYLITFAVFVLGVFFLTSCSSDDVDKSYEENLEAGLEYQAANGKREGVVTTATGLQYEVLREGKEGGKRPKPTDSVRCNYKGSFIDGKVFDYSSNPIVFPLQGVIEGWTEGLQYMTEGAKYRFVIPYQLGYGARGYSIIPPYSTLIFEVELIEVL